MGDDYSNGYDHLFKKYATLEGLDWKFLKRISWIESRVGTNKYVRAGILNPKDIEGSKSSDGKSWGIMQIVPSTAQDYDKSATPERLNDPEFSIKIASKHIKFLKTKYFGNNERDIAMAYNHGQGNQLNFIKKEKDGTLKQSEYLAGRDYYKKYLTAKELIP